MGNGSVKSKHSKHPDGHSGNLTTDALRNKVTELERELKRKDAVIQEQGYHLKELWEQLSKQTGHGWAHRGAPEQVHPAEQGSGTCREEACFRPLQVKCLLRSSRRLWDWSLSTAAGEQRLGCLPSQQLETTTSTNLLNCPLRKQIRKDSSEKPLITDALNENQFLKRLNHQQIKDMVERMYGRNYQQGSYVI